MFRLFVLLSIFLYSFNALLLIAGTHRVVNELSVTNVGPSGSWKTAEFCPVGHYAVGVNVKVRTLII